MHGFDISRPPPARGAGPLFFPRKMKA